MSSLRRLLGVVYTALALSSGACDDTRATGWNATRIAATPSPQRPVDGVHPALPLVPVGLDAYRMWDRLPTLRYGVRSYMRSTCDRSGGNDDASHFLRQESADFSVTLDAAGQGMLYFVRTNHWHGSPWHYVVDGSDRIVTESSTDNPLSPVAGSVFEPQSALPTGLTWTWSTTQGADLNWVPIGFEHSLTLAYGRTHYGTGYYIYDLFAPGADNLSQPIQSWTLEPPAPDVLSFIGQAGEDIAPNGPGVSVSRAQLHLAAGETTALAEVSDGPATVRALKFTVPRSDALALGHARLRVTWDDLSQPSIDAPLALFHGAGTFYNRNGSEWLVKGLLANVHFTDDRIIASAYFPMPYFHAARVELEAGDALSDLAFEMRRVPYTGTNNAVGYFHATYRDNAAPELGHDLVILDTRTTEQGGDFCGTFVGMSWIFSERAVLSTLEGDPRFFFDDSQTPQAQGTGTEEWGGGGDYWGGQNMTLPFAGHPTGAASPEAALEAEDQIESAYRFLLADAMPFGKNARIQLEHGGADDSTEHYQSVAYWYGAPRACLVRTDSVDIGNRADEAAHGYTSPDASEPEIISSRYEWGVDHLGDHEIYPESQEDGRHTNGTSELEFNLDPTNVGVLLRREVDYSFPNQRADVFVADASPHALDREFRPAGTWYLAGSNSVVYSSPPGELDAPTPVIQTSNRRFRDDEFLLPRELTEGRNRIRVRLVNTTVATPLLPDLPLPAAEWSELRYWAYSYLLNSTTMP